MIDELIAVAVGGGGGLENMIDDLIVVAVADGENWKM